jgi:hypothetical protein
MLNFKSIVEQVEKFHAMGYGSYSYIDIYLDEEDYTEAYGQCLNLLGNTPAPIPPPTFTFYSTSARIYFYKKEPDYVDGCSYFYFTHKQSVYKGQLPTIDTEVRFLKGYDDSLQMFDCDGNEKYLFDYVKKAFKDGKSCGIVEESGCYHKNTKIVPLFVSGYKMCVDCGEDLGNVSDEEFRSSLKGKNLRFS